MEFSTEEGIYEIIYVKNYEDFSSALEDFYSNFVSSETIQKLMRGEVIESPSELGTVETNVQMYENISTKEAVVSPNSIFSNKEEIYRFLCYGRNEDREYYTVREGDTLQGVGYYFGDMSPRQIMMLNPVVLHSENQIVTPGMQLNVTYYTMKSGSRRNPASKTSFMKRSGSTVSWNPVNNYRKTSSNSRNAVSSP